jgi:transcriptional regulator with XRE-family HTH domain
MNKTNSKIDLIPYFDTMWYVLLNPDFEESLKIRIRNTFSNETLSSLTEKPKYYISSFLRNKISPNLAFLLKICKILNIPDVSLYENILGVYPRTRRGVFYIKSIEIDDIFTEWYGAWIGEGDHSNTREALSLTNYSIELLKLHLYILRRFKFEDKAIKAEIVTPFKQEEKSIIALRWAEILGLSLTQISTITIMENATQEGARIEVWCAALYRIMHKLNPKIRKIILDSEEDIKISYIRGIYAAEGSVKERDKAVRLNMKDKDELIFVQKLLNSLGITSALEKYNPFSRTYELRINGYDNIAKFVKIKGFGLHKKRTEKLEKCFDNYGKLPYCVRLRQIRKLLDDKKSITHEDLSLFLDITYSHSYHLISYFVKKGVLKVDKSDKVYKYSMVNDDRGKRK